MADLIHCLPLTLQLFLFTDIKNGGYFNELFWATWDVLSLRCSIGFLCSMGEYGKFELTSYVSC